MYQTFSCIFCHFFDRKVFLLLSIFIWFSFIICSESSASNARKLRIYLDADRTHHFESARSIEMGIKTAFDEVDNRIQGYDIEFVPVDHRGNAVRSKKNMDRFLDDPDALLILAGLHSPPLIKYREFINKNRILTLVPWAAGGPITRHGMEENWIFRLSIDDTKAGQRLADFASNDLACKRPSVLLERTAWGRSNQETMTIGLQMNRHWSPNIKWFDWGLTAANARIIIRDVINYGSECILLVSNAVEGALFAEAMAFQDKQERIPIVSHWGITGGKFHERINSKIRENLELYFIQTCFSFVSSTATPISTRALERAMGLFPDEIGSAEDIRAPVGFIHAYDLGLIIRAALENVALRERAERHRGDVRTALENLNQPIEGLVRRYAPPFEPYHPYRPDAHEALGMNDLCMATFGSDDQIVLYEG